MMNKWLRKQIKKYIKYALKKNVKQADNLDKWAREYEMENDSEFIDWQDNLNEISVR